MIESRSPQRPDDVLVRFAPTDRAGVHEAFAVAASAQSGWARDAGARAGALSAFADAVQQDAAALAELIVREVGKPVVEARGEVARAVAILRYYAQQVFDPAGAVHEPSLGGLLFTRRRPVGVAGLITPWNFPIAIPLWKAAPAVAFGNTVVLKPAPEATACALRLAEIADATLPAGVFQVTPGDARTGAAVSEAADLVSFTGSVAAGRAVARTVSDRGRRVQAEMGGQNPAVVLPDADPVAAAAQIAAAAMGYAGQKCTATKRVIVVGPADALRDALVAAVAALPVGDPAETATVVGPVINAQSRDRVGEAMRSARAGGARVLTGDSPVDRDGWYQAPVVLDGVPAGHELLTDEVFGPICALQSAGSVDDAVRQANAVRFGLAAAVYTRDLGAALSVSDRLQAGLIKVNAPTSGVDFYLPFGGEKDSSVGGREQGKAAQDFYTSVHTTTLTAPA